MNLSNLLVPSYQALQTPNPEARFGEPQFFVRPIGGLGLGYLEW